MLKRFALEIYRLFLIFLLALIFLTGIAPLEVKADGGAPNLAYISGSSVGISVIDVGQGQVTRNLAISGNPQMILLSLDGRSLYVTQPANGAVAIIAAKTGEMLCSAHLPGEPSLLALNQDGSTLYAAGNGATVVTALDAQNCSIQHTFQTGSPVYGLAYGSNLLNNGTDQLWVAGTQALTIFNGKTAQKLGSVSLPENPQYLSIPPGTMVYVTTRQGSVEAVDTGTHAVHQLLTGGVFGPMDYDALTSEIYVPDQQHNLLDILAPLDTGMTTLPAEPDRVIHLNNPPQTIAITNNGLLGFVAMQGGDVSMLDLIGRRIAYTVNVGGTPHFVITGLYPPAGDLHPPKNTSPTSPGSNLGFAPYLFGAALLIFVVVMVLLLRQIILTREKHS